MAIRQIVQVGDDVLRKKTFEVTEFGEKLNQLLDDMKDTLNKAEGVGLAAPQIGILRRIFIVDVEDEGFYKEFINPVFISQKGTQYGTEGCLSIKGKWGDVSRPRKIVVKAYDRNGNEFILKAQDFIARAICHEYDHLEGVLYIDKADNIRNDKK